MEDQALRRAVLSVLRYLLRARSRATPFGLFAGVEAARIGAAPALRAGTGHRAVTRPDAAWTAALVDRLEQHPRLRPRLTLLASSLAFERDGRLMVEHRPSSDEGGAPAYVRIRATGPVRMAMDGARTPVSWTDLAAMLSAGFPTASPTAIDNLLANLVRQRFLTTSLRPAVTAADPIAVLLRQAQQHLPTADADGLHEVATALARHDTATAYATTATGTAAAPATTVTAPAHARAERARLTAAMTRLCPTVKPALALDLRLDWDLVIRQAVAQEAASAATVLTRLAPRAALSPGWTDWHDRFLDRYGPAAAVPVLDALDLLGYPPGYLGSTPAPNGSRLTARDSRLLRLAHTAAMKRHREVRLDDAAIGELALTHPGRPVQPSTENRAAAKTMGCRHAAAWPPVGLGERTRLPGLRRGVIAC